MTKNTLFYKGVKPNIYFYNPDVDVNLYNDLPTHWDSQITTIDYLEKDLKSLYEVIRKFSEYIFLKYSIQVNQSVTISSLAMKIFLKKYYSDNIPLINQRSIYDDIKNSYFGGITEVYKPYGENLYYYDVNSLYPYAALNPMPGKECYYDNDINLSINDMTNLFGFYYCKIETSKLYLGLLPYRTSKGIIMPEGSWEGWYFSEQLNLLASTKKDAPEDFYNFILLSVRDYIRSWG